MNEQDRTSLREFSDRISEMTVVLDEHLVASRGLQDRLTGLPYEENGEDRVLLTEFLGGIFAMIQRLDDCHVESETLEHVVAILVDKEERDRLDVEEDARKPRDEAQKQITPPHERPSLSELKRRSD